MNISEIFLKKQKKILIIGDIMLDQFLCGEAMRISPEAPVPIISGIRISNHLGGAANVASNLAKWNVDTTIFGLLGNDPKGLEILGMLNAQSIKFNESCLVDGRETITKIRVVAGSQHVCRIDFEMNPDKYAPTNTQTEKILSSIPDFDAVIVSDYAKGFVTEKLMQSIIDKCREYNKILCVDPKPRNKIKFRNPYLLKPNKKEALELADMRSEEIFEYPTDEVCRRIFEKYSPKYLVVTLGEQGMLLANADGTKRVFPTKALSVFDVSGAGDTVISMLAFALSCGMTIEEAIEAASLAAGIVVGKAGTSQAEISEILNAK